MGTLSSTLTLTSSDVLSDTLNVTDTDSLTTAGDVLSVKIATSTTAAVFLAAADYGKSYVFLKNTSSTTAERIDIRASLTGTDIMQLGAGEYAFFPWAGSHDLAYDAASGTPVLEVMLFEVA